MKCVPSNGISGCEKPDYGHLCRAVATDRYEAMQEVIREAQGLYRQYNLHAALQYIVIEDQQLPYLVSSLRMALNALQKYFDR
ncbi:hypothetical protein [Bartonella schoenbuchensis]|uniref:hypothetical protein n=1 Tax=Bartonella schoenbuchensis TaxID=165694 RepID=UPI0031453809